MPKQGALAVVALFIIIAVILLGYFGLGLPLNLFRR
jgi:hypothetical protein